MERAMKVTVMVLALVILAGCERKPPPPPVQPANEDKSSVELKLDTKNGAVEFKKEEGSSDKTE
jgi:hypothetical protein